MSGKPFLAVILLMATRNPLNSPVEVGSLSHSLEGFSTIPGGAGFLLSTVSLSEMFAKSSLGSYSLSRFFVKSAVVQHG